MHRFTFYRFTQAQRDYLQRTAAGANHAWFNLTRNHGESTAVGSLECLLRDMSLSADAPGQKNGATFDLA